MSRNRATSESKSVSEGVARCGILTLTLGIIGLTSFAGSLCTAYPKESRSDELKTISITTIILSVTLLGLRLYSRWLKSGRLWSDDAFAIVAAVRYVMLFPQP